MRLWYVGDAYRLGMTTDEIFQLSAYDPWFLEKIRELIATDGEIDNCRRQTSDLDAAMLRSWKEMGFADARIAKLVGLNRSGTRQRANSRALKRFSILSTPAARNFKAFTPYLYSTYEGEDESKRTHARKS